MSPLSFVACVRSRPCASASRWCRRNNSPVDNHRLLLCRSKQQVLVATVTAATLAFGATPEQKESYGGHAPSRKPWSAAAYYPVIGRYLVYTAVRMLLILGGDGSHVIDLQ